jgi:hypothetical protein
VIIINLLHVLNQFIQPDVVEIFIVTLRDVVIRVLRVFLTHNGENNVIGVKITCRFEEFIANKLHPITQGEGIGFAIRGDGPGFRQ